MRMFRDDQGRLWTVYDVSPTRLAVGRLEFLPPTHAGGWLVFDHGEERRRLVPCPPEWADFPEAALRLLLDSAERVTARHPSRDITRNSDAGPTEQTL